MKKVIGFLVIGLILAFAAGAGFLFLSPDYEAQVVRSESMKPSLNMGDVVIVGPVKGQLKPGDIISYEQKGALIIHRVIEVKDGNIQTKGDANEAADPWLVSISDVKGVFQFKVPYLGFLSSFVRTSVGWGVLVILPAVVLIGYFVRDIFKRND
jgi:signal peptidase